MLMMLMLAFSPLQMFHYFAACYGSGSAFSMSKNSFEEFNETCVAKRNERDGTERTIDARANANANAK